MAAASVAGRLKPNALFYAWVREAIAGNSRIMFTKYGAPNKVQLMPQMVLIPQHKAEHAV
jgi:hypothetical protein